MICVHLNSVLLITPDGGVNHEPTEQPYPEPWMQIEARTVGDALRQVRFHKPGVLVFDLSEERVVSPGFEHMLRIMTEVRARIPNTSIVVLGAVEEPAMEPTVRRHGATVYLPVSLERGRSDARRIIHALYARHGPNKTHGPPTSGVPPR